MISRITLLLFIGLAWGQNSPNPQRFNKNPEGDNVSIDLFRLWDKKNSTPKYPVVFVGSSSIRKWSTAEYFPDIPIVNRGFGGSHISDVNHFINETVLKYKPRVIIFYAGQTFSTQNIIEGNTVHKMDYLVPFDGRLHQDIQHISFDQNKLVYQGCLYCDCF